MAQQVDKQAIIAELKRRASSGHPDAQRIQEHFNSPQFKALGQQTQQQAPQAPAQQSMTQNPDINALIQKAIQPKGVRQNLGDALSILGGGKPENNENTLNNSIVSKYVENNMTKPKTELELLIEKGKAAGAARELGDRNMFNSLQTGNGNQTSPTDNSSSILGEQGNFLGEIDPFTKKPTPRALEAQNALKMKQAETNAQARADIKTQTLKSQAATAATMIEKDLDDVLKTYNQIPSNLTGPIEGRTLGPMAQFFQTKGGEKASEYGDTSDFIMANISRQLGGEKGVLTDADIARIKKALPLMRDKAEVAQAKIDRIKRFIKRRVDQAGTGQLPGFGADMEDELSDIPMDSGTGDIDSELDAINQRLAQLGG